MIKVGFDYIKKSRLANLDGYKERVKEIHEMIHNKSGLGSEFLGWVDYAEHYDKAEVERILKKAAYCRKNYNTLVVCGIGGSYLGSRAAIEALNGLHSLDSMEIVYLGNTLDPNYISQTMKYLKTRNYCVCVISKSGTTTETSVSFRLLREDLEAKYGKEETKNRIIAVTDKSKGALRTLCNNEGYESYILPDDIGGRFSVITPVGLFPIACAGIDIKEFLKGFGEGEKEYNNPDVYTNEAYKYACQRNYLYREGYSTEMLISYELQNKMLIEWWKQLFDESEGKTSKALLATSAIFTTDLHSMGQFIQDGSKVLFETVIYVNKANDDIIIPNDSEDLDGLNYLTGKDMSFVNHKAYEGTLKAHSEVGDVPNITITLDVLDARNLGHFMNFFMNACAMSAYMLGVNPFNQPGVEIYKKNMFHLLGKKGY
ncbi:MAG: glucose-6-phosphate isomerase [Bacilli bacterium]|jgi:glucose-6-phosphate isomerase